MRYRLATYRECKAHRDWNTTCPSCGRRGKFSPYIDTVTMRPVDDRQCGRCNRLSNCGYHLPPREMPRTEDFISRGARGERENPGPVNYVSHRSHKSHRSCIAESSQLPSGVYTRRSRQQGRSDLPFREICEICESKKQDICVNPNHQREVEEFYEKMRCACEQSQPWGSHLVTWLRTKFPREQVAAALKRYRVGGTPDGATLWWQIDEQGRVHTGKAMQYNPLTGHRVKTHPNPPCEGGNLSLRCQYPLPHREGWGGSSPVNWAHRMRLYGEPAELVVPQCLFGLHLIETHLNPPCEGGLEAPRCQYPLPYRADARGASVATTADLSAPRSLACELWGGSLCIVESEKTALILSLVCPDKLWLATGGKANFKESMLWPLVGCDVEVYPDADALHDWYTRAVELNRRLGTRLHIPTWYYNLMDHPEAIAQGLDLADVMICGVNEI